MSHSFTWTDPETGFEIYINHNSDMSGEARISVPKELVKIVDFDKHPSYSTEIYLPAKLLAAFGRNATVQDAIEALEGLYVEG